MDSEETASLIKCLGVGTLQHPTGGRRGGVVVRNGPLGGVGSVCIDFFFSLSL